MNPDRILIEGTEYAVRYNDDPDCPVSISRIYEPGERRTRLGIGCRMTQEKQADGTWKTIKTVSWL